MYQGWQRASPGRESGHPSPEQTWSAGDMLGFSDIISSSDLFSLPEQFVFLPPLNAIKVGKEKGSCLLLAQTNFLQKHSGEKAEATGFYV